MSQVDWYEFGLRATQASRLIPSDPELQRCDASDQKAALLALVLAANRAASMSLGGHLAEQIKKLIESCYDRFVSDHGTDEHASQCLRAGIGRELIAVKCSLLEASQEIPVRTRLWFRLGVEIADGIDESWSEGKPTFRPQENGPQQSLVSALVFVDPQPPNWEWQNAEAVIELTQQLNVTVDDLFPPHHELTDTDFERLGGLDFRRYWGWCSLERGVYRLRQLMASSPDGQLVTIAQIARVVHRAEKTLRNRYTSRWPDPAISHSGQIPAQWWYHELKPVLHEQFPDKTLPDVVS